MFTFSQRLDHVLKEWQGNQTTAYMNPDQFYKEPQAFPIFYTSDNHIYYGRNGDTHGKILCNNRDLFERYIGLFGDEFEESFLKSWGTYKDKVDNNQQVSESIEPSTATWRGSDAAFAKAWEPLANNGLEKSTQTPADERGQESTPESHESSEDSFWNDDIDSHGEYSQYSQGRGWHHGSSVSTWRDYASSVDLLGRVNSRRSIVSFWNEDEEIYQKLLAGCIKKLLLDGTLHQDAQLSTPVHGTIPISSLATAQTTPLNDQQREELALRQRMHVANGAEKLDIMQKLGLGSAGGKPHQMQTALRDAGLQAPGQKWWAPTSEAFSKRLNRILSEWEDDNSDINASRVQQGLRPLRPLSKPYRDPHGVYEQDGGAVPFIYAKTGELMYGKPGGIHANIVDANQEFFSQPYPEGPYRQFGGRLYGRISADKKLASFWNKEADVYAGTLDHCLAKLIKDGALTQDAQVSTPVHGTIPISNLAGQQAAPASLTPEQEEQLRQQRELHLMNPAQKGDAMRQKGVPFSKKNPWNAAAEKIGAVAPGQKIWAPTSEDQICSIAAILTDDPDVTAESRL